MKSDPQLREDVRMLQAEVDRLRAENAELRARKPEQIIVKVPEVREIIKYVDRIVMTGRAAT